MLAPACTQCGHSPTFMLSLDPLAGLVPVTVEPETFYVCEACIEQHAGPGKFEGNGDDLALALVLHALMLDSGEDHFLSDESGYMGQFGRFVLTVDDRGFVSAEEFASPEKAEARLNDAEDDGFGASEDDAWISLERGGYHVSFAAKSIGTFETERRARAAVSVEMRRTGYYPNVFLAGEHGPTVRRIDVW